MFECAVENMNSQKFPMRFVKGGGECYFTSN